MAAAGGPDGGGTLHCCVDAFDHERQRHPSSPSAAQSPESPFAALDCVDCPPVGRAGEGGGAGGAILRHPLLSRLNGYCLVDFVSLAEDLAIITIVRTNRVGRWRTRLLKVFLLLPYGVHVAEFLCARLRPLRYPNAVIPPLSEVVQAVLFVRIAGETYQSVAVFVAFAAVQITLLFGSDDCLSEVCARSVGVGSADMAFFVATGLALFGAVFALLPLFCDPDGRGGPADYAEIGAEVRHMIYDNPAVHAAMTVFLWGIGSFGHVPWLDSVCVCAGGAAYVFVTGWSIGLGVGSTEPDGRCATLGYLWSVLSVSALLTPLWWDGQVLRGTVLYDGCSPGAERVYLYVRSGLLFLGLLAVVPLWIIGEARGALVEGCAMFLALPFAAGCGNYFFYAREMEGVRMRQRRSEVALALADTAHR